MPRVRRPTDPIGVTATAALRQSTGGSSGSFLVVADDGRRYWCKSLNNLQHPRVPANEQIVGRLGALIGAPVCDVALVRIPDDLAGWEFRPGHALEVGLASGSLAVEPAVETRALDNRALDDNARRHAGIYALHDWLGGSDAQWLMFGGDAAFYSHDHGHYFPGGPGWTIENLEQSVGGAFPLGFPTAGLDNDEIERLAQRLDAVTEEEVVGCVANVPADWPVQDDELEALIDFVYGRRPAVAERLRAMVAGV